MKDNSQDKDQPVGPPEELPGGASQALSSALQKTFESLLQEPVPEKFEALIARIREAEARKAEKPDNEES
ncbi:NepR family anti-sigma factor [Hyphomonas sp.]|uniref:NepR family anti-sigma factor n=1 Tax=Hyphomonas sp. TaxID=87 RepID=UPI003527EDFC